MESLREKDIIKFLKENIEPFEDKFYGTGFRASVYLKDGTYLPCVIFRDTRVTVELAIRRFAEYSNRSIFNHSPKNGYYDVVKSFVAKGNCINAYDIVKVEKSRFALPISILKQIHGETRMSWTCFVGKMNDEKCFTFATTFLMDFFNMPEKYSADDIDEIINHSYISKEGEIKSCYANIETPTNESDFIYRERPYFDCYLDSL